MFSFGLKKTPPAPPINSAALVASGALSPKDIIAPSFVEVDFNHIKIDDYYYRTFFVVGYPHFASTNWLSSLLTFDHSLYISFFIYPTHSQDIVKDLTRKIAEMEATIESDVKAGRVVDPYVQVALDDALSLQAELAQGGERFFQFAFYITVPAQNKEELDKISKEVDATMSSLLIIAKPASLEMEEGFKSSLPLFQDSLRVWRNMDTSSIALMFPFSTASLTANEGIMYGINEHDGSLIIFDRFTLENANMVVLGKSGSGKTFMVKLEVLRQLMMGTDVIIIDPENEYEKISAAVNGEMVSFSLSSQYRINPFELLGDADDPDELANKILGLHSLMKVIVGELTPTQDALLDKALVLTYKKKGITQEIGTHKKPPPLLGDLYDVFINMGSGEGADLAARLEKFVQGSASGIFNQNSNFDIKNRFTVFGVRDLEENLRPVAMHVVLDYIWNRIRKERRPRILVVDEAWYLVKNKDTASYLFGFAKRARKYGLGLTTITQDVEDFLNTEEGRAILTNSSLQVLLKQSTAAIEKVAETFNLTRGEKSLLLGSGIGSGLFFAGRSHVGINVVASDEESSLLSQT